VSTDLVSSAPGIYSALLKLVEQAAAEQSPKVPVFAYEVGQWEPQTYLTVHAIEHHEWEIESIPYQFNEKYEVVGCATVFSGSSPFTTPTVGVTVMNETFNLFNACVMTQIVSHRTAPFLETTGPTPQIMLPTQTDYTAGPGRMEGGPAGWCGEMTWRVFFEAIITPA
jgi:hypothetical protein